MEASGKAWLVMPLYIYPLTTETWKPLYDIIGAHPDINFLVVVNPNSGPGDSELPSHDYVREVPKLNAFANVCTVGYVRIGWCKRPLKESCDDIGLYAGWRRDDTPGLYVQGIYVDETPNHISEASTQYLDAISHFIKTSDGLLDDKLVVHNPGTPPEGDVRFFGNPDLVCVCEEPFKLFHGENLQHRLELYSPGWARSIYQISGVPDEDIGRVVGDLCRRGKYVFATDLVDDFYESFGPSWASFAAAIRAHNSSIGGAAAE